MAHPRILLLSGYNQLPGNAVLPRDTAPQYNQLPGMYWEEAPRILLLSTTSYQECTGKKHPGYCSSVQPATRNVLGRSSRFVQQPGVLCGGICLWSCCGTFTFDETTTVICWKILPLYDMLLSRFQNNTILTMSLFVDESMVQYFGKSGNALKQRMPIKLMGS